MYSGTTLRVKSGRLIGVHQRIDRLAHRYTRAKLAQGDFFPTAKEIIHFEGRNGPDGIKQKQPARDEPWHYIDPKNPEDTELLDMIESHHHNLTQALAAKDSTRAAFESAWLAHAITDGLTPAHHYPLEDKLVELRAGKGIETRTSFMKKNLMPGDTLLKQLANNWEYWGAKGIMTSHGLFEAGVAMAIPGRRFETVTPGDEQLGYLLQRPVRDLFKDALAKVDSLQMYQLFIRRGWTRELTHLTNQTLMPTIIRTVMIAWLQAVNQAKNHEAKSN